MFNQNTNVSNIMIAYTSFGLNELREQNKYRTNCELIKIFMIVLKSVFYGQTATITLVNRQ